MKADNEKRRKAFRIASDSIWSIAGLVLMNVVVQFVIYPIWNQRLGNETYGRILYLISGMNILAVSFGVATNYARMKSSINQQTYNRTYQLLLGGASVFAIPYIFLYSGLSSVGSDSVLETGLLVLLTIATMWRYYADVEYRLSLNYRQFFLYYLVISIGYGVGILLFLKTNLWPLSLLIGEVFGLILVAAKGNVLRIEPRRKVHENSRAIVHSVLVLLLTEIISNLIFNGDRVLLKLMSGGVAVTIYYQASLLGKTMTLITTPLNSVLIGYLSRTKLEMSRKMMNLISLAAFGLFILCSAACLLASHLVIRMLYPQNYELVKSLFLVANAAQIAYFLSGMISTILLRYCKMKYQLYINLVYAALFAGLCIPATGLWGLRGFCYSLLSVCLLRVIYVLFLGYRYIRKAEKEIRP